MASVLFANGLVIDGLGGYLDRADELVEDARFVRVGHCFASPDRCI